MAGVDQKGISIIKKKAKIVVIRVDGISSPPANIVKQQMLSLGGDAAVNRDVITGKKENSTLYIVGDLRKLLRLPRKLSGQPFNLPELGENIEKILSIYNNPPKRVKIRNGELGLDSPPIIMGVLNVTPDSFSDGGIYFDQDNAYKRGMEMVEEGADIIDVGGESTRPGADAVETKEELNRVLPVVEKLSENTDIPISIDTRKPVVAEAAINRGVRIVNDISGFNDPEMIRVVTEGGAATVVMHMQGDPKTMQANPHYLDTITEITDWLKSRTDRLVQNGIEREKIIIDPGIGFGKRLNDNLEILNHIGDFRTLGFPVLVGYSRKSFLGTVTGRDTEQRLWGGFAALAKCIVGEVSVVRVHDVKETRDFLQVWNSIEHGDRTN